MTMEIPKGWRYYRDPSGNRLFPAYGVSGGLTATFMAFAYDPLRIGEIEGKSFEEGEQIGAAKQFRMPGPLVLFPRSRREARQLIRRVNFRTRDAWKRAVRQACAGGIHSPARAESMLPGEW